MFVPFLDHWKLNGPVPAADVLKMAVVPGQLVWLLGPVAV